MLADQYKKLAGYLRELWPDQAKRPWIIGPDENPDGIWLHEFLAAADGVVDAVTYHQYSVRADTFSIWSRFVVSLTWKASPCRALAATRTCRRRLSRPSTGTTPRIP